jgi:hypothetical protein
MIYENPTAGLAGLAVAAYYTIIPQGPRGHFRRQQCRVLAPGAFP